MDKRRFDGLRDGWPRLHRFLTAQESPYPVAREVTFGAALVLLVLGTLWGYTGQPLGDTPIVVVESGSMMHCEQPPGVANYGRGCDPTHFGRLGTIDPGDLIFVKDIDRPSDVETRAETGEHHYRRSGDVIIFRPDGRPGVPIIHRALFWLEIHGDGTFSVPEFGLSGVTSLDQPQLIDLGLSPGYADDLRSMRAGPEDSGFITRGDNNGGADQDHASAIASLPVRPDWILGVARGEVPWLGLVKLYVTDVLGVLSGAKECPILPVSGGSAREACNYHNAGADSKFLLAVTLTLLLAGPFVYEKVRAARRANESDGTP